MGAFRRQPRTTSGAQPPPPPTSRSPPRGAPGPGQGAGRGASPLPPGAGLTWPASARHGRPCGLLSGRSSSPAELIPRRGRGRGRELRKDSAIQKHSPDVGNKGRLECKRRLLRAPLESRRRRGAPRQPPRWLSAGPAPPAAPRRVHAAPARGAAHGVTTGRGRVLVLLVSAPAPRHLPEGLRSRTVTHQHESQRVHLDVNAGMEIPIAFRIA